jgi:Ca2+-binding EF-hand superfamily protein
MSGRCYRHAGLRRWIKVKMKSYSGMFFEVCRMIDPTISSLEVQLLFKELDTSKDNFIDYNEFKVLIL